MVIGTKWVYRNKKDERGVVVINKERIEAITIFLAFASYMGFIVYQMDMENAFLYGKIDEEVIDLKADQFLAPLTMTMTLKGIFQSLLDNYSLSLHENESYHFGIPSPYRPPAKPPDGKTGTLNIKMICDVSDQKVPIPGLTITRILNQEKSPDLLPHQGLEAFQHSPECPMIINEKNTPLLDVLLFHFYPL
nr:retrovirus-related Pol polyprotein from transposon TNT 1-94 [Tanacetum cinerariifolium]